MSGFELNKIAAAVILAGLIGMVTSKVADILYVTETAHHGDPHHEVKRGYSIEVPEVPADGVLVEKKDEGAPDITAILASAADAAAGEAFFAKRCATCHTHEKGGKNKIGPNLYGVHNNDKGVHAGFKYSKAMSSFGGQWTYETLNQFLYKPKKWMPGTIMAYAGIRKDQDRANVIAYLRSLEDSPAALPDMPAEAPAEEAAAE